MDNITSEDGRIICRKEWEKDVVRSGRAVIKMKKQTIIPCHCQHAKREEEREKDGDSYKGMGISWLSIAVVVLLPTYSHQVSQ